MIANSDERPLDTASAQALGSGEQAASTSAMVQLASTFAPVLVAQARHAFLSTFAPVNAE